ncbi:MAG: hypothetical protein AAF394_16935, partial [Planctomycetota bacterium]
MTEGLHAALSDICGRLNSLKIRHALIGGLAASLRGRVRATNDIDLIILCNLERALSFVESFDSKDFVPLIDDFEDVARAARSYRS